ncbi:MAG: 5-(carboxyamino)imidazole ribonucleotide mutase [Crenarchaeota archaeon]|nr:5-(carboxyamino)imidazole ribonucleotide mutase [Thermoproteota archaeon]
MTLIEKFGDEPLVAIVVGSERDLQHASKAAEVLKKLGIPYEIRVLSAHRNPEELDKYIRETPAKIFIAMAGLSAALPGYIASRTDRPVIGVPLAVALMGLDALLSMVQMPRGVPVAVVGIDNAVNAALLACRILKIAGLVKCECRA